MSRLSPAHSGLPFLSNKECFLTWFNFRVLVVPKVVLSRIFRNLRPFFPGELIVEDGCSCSRGLEGPRNRLPCANGSIQGQLWSAARFPLKPFALGERHHHGERAQGHLPQPPLLADLAGGGVRRLRSVRDRLHMHRIQINTIDAVMIISF
mgnify:CR=1 FL=1